MKIESNVAKNTPYNKGKPETEVEPFRRRSQLLSDTQMLKKGGVSGL